jgi:hypothetical protein
MEGDKVKITVMFRGREMVHTYKGREQLDQVLQHLKPIAKLENPPRMEGRFMSMILVADREAVDAAKKAAAQDAAKSETHDETGEKVIEKKSEPEAGEATENAK